MQTPKPESGIDLFPPYAASIGWYRRWYQAGRRFPATERRLMTRAEICGAAGPQQLTVPLQGSRKALRYAPAQEWTASEHGNWRHVHLRAIEAAYGRTPYFLHHYPRLEAAIGSGEASFGRLSRLIHSALLEAIAIPEDMPAQLSAPVIAEARRLQALMPEQLSMVHAAMHLGPDAIFLLLPTL